MMRDEALRYIAIGYPVLPCHTVLVDDDGEKLCTCLDPLCWTQRHSIAKHPRTDLVPRAVYDATLDAEVIARWPEDNYNLGIAGRDRFVFIDIDDSEITKQLLENVDVNKDLIICVTRRGCHIWIRTTEDTANGIIKLKDGRKIGEIRAAGYYVIAPPSLHIAGHYSWFGASPFDREVPEYKGDGWAAAAEILYELGYEMLPKSQTLSVVPTGKVTQIELPFEAPVEAVELRQMLSGTFPTNDRSAALFHLACEAARWAKRVNYSITLTEIAGVVAKVDAIMYQKYTGRPDSDRRYLEIGAGALQELENEVEKAVSSPAVQIISGGAVSSSVTADFITINDFVWDKKGGNLSQNVASGKTTRSIPLANFLPIIKSALTVWNGPDIEPRTDWIVETAQPGSPKITVRLEPEDYQEDRLNARALSRKFPPTHIVRAGKWPTVLEAMKVFSQGVTKHRLSYAVTGWADRKDAFVLPAAPGAITAEGFDEGIVYENPDAVERIYAYGKNVQPPERPIDDAVTALLTTIPPRVLVPLLTQTLAAPLTSLGVGKDKTVIHLFGKTGSYKTSLIKVVLSLYGQFHENPVIDSWASTTASIELPAHQYRDLPLAVDDYKVSALRRGEENKAISFVQSYADNTARGRMTANQRERQRLVSRCLLITTGEDVWESHQSALARTLVIGITRDEIEFPAIAHLASLAEAGRFAELGYLWLQWLCQMGQRTLSVQIPARREQRRRELEGQPIATEHPRMATAVANLRVVSDLFMSFLEDEFPGAAEAYREREQEGWLHTLTAAARQASEARDLSPYQQMVTALREGFDFGEAHLIKRRQRDVPYPTAQRGDGIGYIDESYIHLTERAYGWLAERRHREGRTLSFGWQSFRKEAIDEHGAIVPEKPIHYADENRSRRGSLLIPIDEILPEYAEEIGSIRRLADYDDRNLDPS